MKYCTKCGAQMNDDALFCPKCGTKFEEVIEESNQEAIEEKPVAPEETSKPKPNAKVKGKATPLHEQKVKEFLPVPLALIGCSIALWIINAVGSPTGIVKIMPLLLFMMLSIFLGVMSLIRGIKTINRKIYFNAALSFTLLVLLFTCLIIDFVFLIG